MFKLLKILTEFMGWIQIVFFFLLAGTTLGMLIYSFMHNLAGLVIAIVLATIILIIGIVYANRVWKTKGTVNLLSNVHGSPVDETENDQKT